jgi:hypothetical protein
MSDYVEYSASVPSDRAACPKHATYVDLRNSGVSHEEAKKQAQEVHSMSDVRQSVSHVSRPAKLPEQYRNYDPSNKIPAPRPLIVAGMVRLGVASLRLGHAVAKLEDRLESVLAPSEAKSAERSRLPLVSLSDKVESAVGDIAEYADAVESILGRLQV